MLIVFERPTTNRQQARFWDRECNGASSPITHLMPTTLPEWTGVAASSDCPPPLDKTASVSNDSEIRTLFAVPLSTI